MKNLFEINLKSLALFRISLGLILFFDFLNRFSLVKPFYNDGGIATRSYIIDNVEIGWKMSLLNLNGSPVFAYILLTLGVITSLLIAFGARTKLSSFIAWIILLSFQNRFPIINHGGDNLLRILLFFSIFMPTNYYFSLDRFFGKFDQIEDRESVNTPFTFLIFLQIFLMYGFTFVYKWDPAWLTRLDSLYYAMNLDIFTTILGEKLLGFPKLMSALSFFTLWVEGLGPLLLLIPWKKSAFRSVAFVLFWGLHLGILFTMHLGNFPWICLALWIPILPENFWRLIKKVLTRNTETLTLYYDGECGFCRRFCILLKEVLFVSNLIIKPSTDDSSINEIINSQKSWLLIDSRGTQSTRFNVFAKLLDSSIFFPLGVVYNLSPILAIGNYAYKHISKYRFLIGKTLTSFFQVDIKVKTNWPGKTFATLLILLSFSWNLEGYLGSDKFDVKDPFTSIAFTLGLNQQWNMFAPKPMSNDAWYIIDGELQDGSRINPITLESISFEKPRYPQDTMENSQWRKFYLNLSRESGKTYMRNFANYICREWNTNNKNKLVEYKIYQMLERTPSDYTAKPEVKQNLIWTYKCYY
ncbi:hypothetical protein [Bacteriovorax sp. Seq25_V]|uniref:hypothetical protein n=1 Tax=Bacteriovorax sp. Seq25_V TaxID=1201288 RepID=UPI00038A1D2D|nr:hypothetical protein [Bacteriovorax sp. Seq25_V]EQC47892.1 hypothetical protein M900_A0041 [Bacteriovorax sp. Seq25_V]